MENNIRDLFEDNIDTKAKKKIEKFKKKEEAKKRRQEKRLEKLEDKIFAKREKLTREAKYNTNKINENKKINLSNIYKISLIITLSIGIFYLVYSLIKKQIPIISAILFVLIIIGFILTSAIQKKKERKITSIITSILFILWMFINM